MKRLLLLFILSPILLFGQTRQKAIVDSIRATATDIRSVSALISNNPGNRVEQVQVTDSDGFVTLVVRVHLTDAGVIPILPPMPLAKIKTGVIVAGILTSVNVPPLPRLVVEPDTIIAQPLLAVFKFDTKDIPVVKLDMVIVPPLPRLKLEIETTQLLAVFELDLKDIPVVKLDTVVVPPLPAVKPVIEAIPLLVASQLRMEDIVAGKVDPIIVPALPDILLMIIEAVPPVILAIEYLPAGKMDTVATLSFEENKMLVSGMHLSPEGYDLLEKLEGFSPELYSLQDGGLTIGFGFFIPDGEGSKWAKGMTWEDAERMIRQKMPTYEDQVKQYINVPLTQKEFDALTMLAYNLGGFSKATSIVNDVNSDAGFDQLQRDWMRFVHSKAPGVMKGLMNRRRDEMLVRNESNYQPERKIQILKTRK